MKARPNEPPVPEPLAYFLTWPTYGTWLPGDARGWVARHRGWQDPDPIRQQITGARMKDDACLFDEEQRLLVEAAIAAHCQHRHWDLHAASCRTNHVHVVVSAPIPPEQVQSQLKSWCTRRLKELESQRQEKNGEELPVRNNWWAERGSRRWINDQDGLEQAVNYVRDGQDRKEYER